LRVDDQDDITPGAAVGAVRSAQGLELLPPHGGTTVPAVTAPRMQDHPVDEAGHFLVPSAGADVPAPGRLLRPVRCPPREKDGGGPATFAAAPPPEVCGIRRRPGRRPRSGGRAGCRTAPS